MFNRKRVLSPCTTTATGTNPTGEQVGGVLDADGDPDEVVRQAALCAHGGGDAGVAHVARQADQARHAAEADRDLEQLRLLCDRPTRRHAAPAPETTQNMPKALLGPQPNLCCSSMRVTATMANHALLSEVQRLVHPKGCATWRPSHPVRIPNTCHEEANRGIEWQRTPLPDNGW